MNTKLPEITIEKLIESGYMEWKSSMLKEDNKRAFQKIIRNNSNLKLYFIDIFYWNDFGMFSSEVFFYLNEAEEGEYFKVHYNINKYTTIAELESFYSEIYEKMKCVPNVLNN
jgi:hypothetical protein